MDGAIKMALDAIKVQSPELYRDAMRELHILKYGPHYDEESARSCVHDERYAYSDVIAMVEPYLSMMSQSDTMWDAYVAINRWYSDLGRNYERRGESHAAMVEDAMTWAFDDDDAPDGKVWRYLHAMTD